MIEHKRISDLSDAQTLPSSEILEVNAEDLKRWYLEMQTLSDSVKTEREECIMIAEHHLGQLYHGHGAGGEMAIAAIIRDIRARGGS
ncbi:MAG TPA: hypothetical protein VFI91_04500 [Longimicrobiaceae bacterium]|nr:hypothetical protein [Longimicrobiaceae bacterium]